MAVSEGMNTLKMAASNAVKDGLTSIAEMIKATYEAEEDDASEVSNNPLIGKASGSTAKADSNDDELEMIELEQID